MPGTYSGHYPTVGGLSLHSTPPPTLLLSAGTCHVVLRAVYDLEVAHGYVYSATLTEVTIEVRLDPGGDYEPIITSSTGVFEFPIATFVDGTKVSQALRTSLWGGVCDNNQPGGVAILSVERV